MDSIGTFPNHQIDPREKDYNWIKQYIQAVWNESKGLMGGKLLYFGQSRYAEIRQYGLGKQSINKYKKILGVDEIEDKSWMNISWEVPSFLTKYREIAISKLVQKQFDIQAFAVDPLAKSEEDKYFNEQKVKIMMREKAKELGSELADHPILKPQQGEPEDMEQLQMQMDFGYKHVKALETEQVIQLIQQQNNIDEIRKRTVENLFDFGIGGYTTWIDENGLVKLREVNPENLILSYCSKNDFSDLVHWGEVIEVRLADIAAYFTKAQMDDICTNVAGKYGNPSNYTPTTLAGYNTVWNKFKVLVLDCKFLSWNDTIYKEKIDKAGNPRIEKTKFQNIKFVSNKFNPTKDMDEGDVDDIEDAEIANFNFDESFEKTGEKGQSQPKFSKVTKEVVFKGKLIIGTDYMYDWGIMPNQSRRPSAWAKTALDIQLYSWNFYKMTFGGITERLMPLEDKACLAWYKLQNLSNKLIPYLINVDFNAIEAVNFGKGGTKASPSEIMNFIFSNFVVPYRSTDLLSSNPNYKPVSIEATGQLAAFSQLYDDLNNTIEMMRQISGLNELTDGSTPNAKTLVPVAAAAQESTNNALYLVSFADKQTMLRLSDSIILKAQISIGLGKIEGYVRALGQQTVKFLQISPDIANYEFGIFLEDAPTQAEREALWQDVNVKESQNLLDVSDKITVMSCRNLKQASIVLSYKIKKRREQMQQEQLAIQQKQAQGNMQVAQATEQMKQQTIQLQGQFEIEKINAQMQWQFIIEKMKKASDETSAQIQSEAKVISNQIMAEAKTYSSHIAAEASKQKANQKTN